MARSDNVLEFVREDDFVEYHLFPNIVTKDECEQEIQLNQILKETTNILQKYIGNYLWHKDEFKLIPRTTNTNQLLHNNQHLPPHLYGVTHVGDNIEDEWFIVFLLRQLTKEIKGLIVRIHDGDGEFILIESADYLPQWADPEICENRVYFFEGNVHLIPPEDYDNPNMNHLTINDGISMIRHNPTETLASTDIQNAIINKLRDYPDKIKENLHYATIYVPIGVAAILKHKPNLISPAIQSFCNRDQIDMKACRAMKYFPPENRVNTRVAFTKCLYAMLTHSKYLPDRRTGWNLPQLNCPQYKAHNLGVKIACGFEILISQAKPSKDIEQDRGWHNYLNNLKEKNYFNGLIEHSRDYNNLLNKAKEYYINHRDSMQYTPLIGQEILELTRTLDYKIDELKKDETNLPPDDDDSWLNINPEELDKMLQEKYGRKRFTTINNNTDAANFTQHVSKFLDHMSGIEGAEFPTNEETSSSPIRPPRGVKRRGKVSFSKDTKSNDKPSSQTSNRINFDPNNFQCAVQNILNFVIPEDDNWDLESGSDMSDYADDQCIDDEIDNKMKQYMDEMDRELAQTTIGESFEKKTNGDNTTSFDDIENFQPVDIDMNALKNILESYRSQLGEAGPSSNMLGPMGIHLDSVDKKK